MTTASEMIAALETLVSEHGDLNLVSDMDTEVYTPEFNDDGPVPVFVVPVEEPS